MKATRKYEYSELKDPGDFFWDNGYIKFLCPCGCNVLAAVITKPKHENGWEWNGDLDKPTVRPSIFINQSENHWHGYLTNGEFKEC